MDLIGPQIKYTYQDIFLFFQTENNLEGTKKGLI